MQASGVLDVGITCLAMKMEWAEILSIRSFTLTLLLKQARMLPRATSLLPSVPPEKWLIKSVPTRRRYETVKVTAFKKTIPSSSASLQSATSVASADDKLISASFNVKVKFRPQFVYPPAPHYHERIISRFSTQLHHLITAPPPSLHFFLVRVFTAPTVPPISSALFLKPCPSPHLACALHRLLLRSSF